ncbi:glycosyltransferase family 2 protein [Sediminibacterium sp.]|uniref:glycosyltransferase family 2 protein n=1 Tax=Sediminibacterium sp. TaxID=1917865 RepID=UPI003F72C02F
MIQEKVSVIIPTYNRINELKQCLISVLNQDYSNIEIIVVSDGYDLNLDFLLKQEFFNKINYFYTDKWTGTPSAARNLGLVKSSADLIAFCDDDDLWLNKKLTTQILFLKKHNFSLVSTNGYIFQNTLHNSLKLFLKGDIKIEPLNNLVYRNQIMTSTVLFRKSHFKISEFNNLFDSDLFVGEDWIAWLKLRCSTSVPFGYLPEPLIYYRISNNSLSKKYNFINLLLSTKKVITLLYINNFYFDCFKAIFYFALRWGRYILLRK